MKQFTVLFLVLVVSSGLVTCSDDQSKEGQSESVQISADQELVESNGCSCDKESEDCGCCAHIKFDRLGIDDDACVNITYLPNQYGVAIALTWNDKVVFNKTISATNPPPICIGVPHVKLLKVCVRLYNISYNRENFGGCVALEFELLAIKEDIPFGCVYKNQAQVRKEFSEMRKSMNKMRKNVRNEMKKNVNDMKKNFEEMKEKTTKEIKKWDFLLSEGFYADAKKKVVDGVDSFRDVLSDVLASFKDNWMMQDKKIEEEKPQE